MVHVSIIIRAFNEERYLPELLESLREQSLRDVEIVVVDSGSFDRTRDIARRYADRLIQIRPDDFTFGYSLNEGIRLSSGRLITIVSAHTRPITPDWLWHLITPLEDEGVAMVYGLQRGRRESKLGELWDFERIYGLEREVLTPPRFFANNANSALPRRLWQEYPFDETLPGLEDIAWAKHWMESGYRIVYEPRAGIYHIHEETWSQVRRRYYREGQAGRWVGVRRRRDLPREVWRESRAFLMDLRHATRTGLLGAKAGEIARFRFEKLAGTVTGVWDGALMQNPTTRKQVLFANAYRGVVIHAAGHASLDELTVPALKPSEALIRVAFEGVCATDLDILDGELGYYKNGQAKYPIVPGHEFSGAVAAVGSRVADLREGERVVVECIQSCGNCAACGRDNWIGCADRREVGVIGRNGGYQEYMITPARFVHRLPPEVDLKDACLCEPVAVVLKGLRRLDRVLSGNGRRRIAVVGGGPIGHLAARVLYLRGDQVTVFDRRETRRELFAGSGIETSGDLTDLSTFEAVIEATGDPDALDAILHQSAPGSVLLLLGLPYARRHFNFETIVGYDKTVVGSVGSGAAEFSEAIALLPRLDTSAFTRVTLPLGEFERAWELARARAHLKVILQVDACPGR